jgi:hypothetical protein
MHLYAYASKRAHINRAFNLHSMFIEFNVALDITKVISYGEPCRLSVTYWTPTHIAFSQARGQASNRLSAGFHHRESKKVLEYRSAT